MQNHARRKSVGSSYGRGLESTVGKKGNTRETLEERLEGAVPAPWARHPDRMCLTNAAGRKRH